MPDTISRDLSVSVRLIVNGTPLSLSIEPRVSLLDALRELIGLSGTKKGCNQGACGACTVIADGERINSCLALAVQYEDVPITTIEGLAGEGHPAGEGLHPLQAAFIKHDGFQCGYCTPGQICSAVAMVAEYKAGMPSMVTAADGAAEFSDAEIKERMSGNVCRCGAYRGIVDAIHETYDGEVAR